MLTACSDNISLSSPARTKREMPFFGSPDDLTQAQRDAVSIQNLRALVSQLESRLDLANARIMDVEVALGTDKR